MLVSSSIILLLCLQATSAELTYLNYTQQESSILYFYRHYMAVFSSDPSGCLYNTSSGTHTILERFDANCSDTVIGGNCTAYVLQSNPPASPSNYVVMFRYPQDMADYAANRYLDFFALTPVNYTYPGTSVTVTIADHYQRAYDRLWASGLGDYMEGLWNATADERRLYVMGHAVGGVLGQIFALHVRSLNWWPRNKIYLISYGSNRVGYEAFAGQVYDAVYMDYIILFKTDALPQLPFTTCNPTGLANASSTADCFYHTGYTIWYNVWMTTPIPYYSSVKCSYAEKTGCIDMGTDTVGTYAYFGYNLTHYDGGLCKYQF
ncbi:hypothetical protein WR25_22213 [Diploscapter pachys]|uniref:Fungal lipase-type domain-containing protein n=1 Tax=Diploscapter pachys TaxID=2018661 RepID=A0A2A2KS91_9BILA|nr:hypothetical protein WR25_22213 [Diploscapter pachys]